jgi:predicted dehydrogenase
MPAKNIDRRTFMATTLSAAAVTIIPRRVLGGQGRTAPGDKLNIAGIGVGGMGAANLNNLQSQNIVALCDVDHNYAAKTFKTYPDAKTYCDYRKMLDERSDIDAVVIATPDHTHAVIAMEAMRRGKHVYCQKPLTHNVYESRILAQAAKKFGVTTQMGIQGHSGEGIRLITEWIQDGAIGEIREVDAWCSLAYYPWGHAYWSSQWSTRPTDTPPVPDNLDWDLWLGPAPHRPYHRAYHPQTWRCWLDFGCGMMGDRGAHTLDPVFTALKLTHPTSIDATSMGLSSEIHPLSSIVTYQFPARGDLPPVKLTWYEGTRPPRPEDLEDGRRLGNTEGGSLFKGTKGKLMAGVYGEAPRIIPETKMKAYTPPPQRIQRIAGTHEMEWVAACKEGRPAGADFEYSGMLTETCLLGNVAQQMDTRLLWDHKELKVTNLPDANKLIKPQYRDGWSLGRL